MQDSQLGLQAEHKAVLGTMNLPMGQMQVFAADRIRWPLQAVQYVRFVHVEHSGWHS